ncbi:group II truncated hemoglobin [Chitinivorax sp. B]|uniref:group II truncated hemoglobin n=1 Tax=Chitinivorax sp. B TaxID=2502235 RepID=UPI0010F63150|nr:group II truncated hemoglobin [Chitinivorax sp. B]
MAELTPYELLGGEAVVRRLVDRFYDYMEQDPRAKHLRDMHPADLTGSRDKLFMFLSGWLGGPDLFVQQFGHPMLRARHLPFTVDEEARDQWIMCMLQAMEEIPMDDTLREHLEVSFWKTADFMRNR